MTEEQEQEQGKDHVRGKGWRLVHPVTLTTTADRRVIWGKWKPSPSPLFTFYRLGTSYTEVPKTSEELEKLDPTDPNTTTMVMESFVHWTTHTDPRRAEEELINASRTRGKAMTTTTAGASHER